MSKLFKRTLALIILLFVLISTAISVITGWQIFQGMNQEFATKGESVASIVADASVLPILSNNPVELQSLIDSYLDIVGIAYILVLDKEGEVLAHTLVPGIPPETTALIQKVGGSINRTAVHREVEHRFAPVTAVVAPILGGSQGNVIVGLDDDIIVRSIGLFLLRQQVAIVILLILSILVSYLFIQRLSGPLSELTQHVRRIAELDLAELNSLKHETRLIAANSKDEVGELARSFNYMERHLSESVSRLADSVARQERMETELSVARDIQSLMLPDLAVLNLPADTVEVGGKVLPAREVGGDFIDCFTLADSDGRDRYLFLAIGDVSGKGVPAALFSAMACTLIRSRADATLRPAQLLQYVNHYMSQNNDACMFVTTFCGLLDLADGRLVYSNAGHLSPLLLAPDGEVHTLERTGNIALGVDEDAAYTERETQIEPGAALLLYTDGITEAMNTADDFFGDDRLLDLFASSGAHSMDALAENLVSGVQAFSEGTEQSDDITMLVLRYAGSQSAKLSGEGSQSLPGEGTFDSVLKLSLKNEISEIGRLLDTFERHAQREGIPDALATRMSIALDEIVGNIMRYALENPDAGQTIDVVATFDDPDLQVTVSDPGPPFDPLAMDEPDIGGSVEDREVGGLGIHVARSLSDDINYRRLLDKNILTLTMSARTRGGGTE